MNSYCIILCFSGVVTLLIFAIFAYFKVEAMKIKDEDRNTVSLNLIIASAVSILRLYYIILTIIFTVFRFMQLLCYFS